MENILFYMMNISLEAVQEFFGFFIGFLLIGSMNLPLYK